MGRGGGDLVIVWCEDQWRAQPPAALSHRRSPSCAGPTPHSAADTKREREIERARERVCEGEGCGVSLRFDMPQPRYVGTGVQVLRQSPCREEEREERE